MEKTKLWYSHFQETWPRRKQQAAAGQGPGDSGLRSQEDSACAYEWLDDIGDP